MKIVGNKKKANETHDDPQVRTNDRCDMLLYIVELSYNNVCISSLGKN